MNGKPVIVTNKLLLRIKSNNFIPKTIFELAAYLTYRNYSLTKTFKQSEDFLKDILELYKDPMARKALVKIMEEYNGSIDNS